ATGAIAADVVYPFQTMNQVDLVLCLRQTLDSNPIDNCPRGQEQSCTTSTTPAGSDPSGMNPFMRTTINCPLVNAGSYELLIVPVEVASCPLPGDPGFDIEHPCFEGPGIDVNGTVTFTAGGTGSGVPTGTVSAKVKGSGAVGTGQRFVIWARTKSADWDWKHAEGRIQYKDDHTCWFRSKYFTNVQITYDSTTQSGTADISGKGWARANGGSWQWIDFSARATDGGPNRPDTFQITNAVCQNLVTLVTQGKIV